MSDNPDRLFKKQGKNIILHIGAPKTASSAIQNCALQNIKSLLDAGYYYPEHRVDTNKVTGGHSVLSNNLSPNKLEKAKKWLNTHYHEARARNATLLISAEGLYANLAGFLDLIAERKNKVFVVGYFRHPVDYVVSGYNQRIKRTYVTEDLITYCLKMLESKPPDNYSGTILFNWAKEFGKDNVCFVPFNRTIFSQNSVVKDFFNRIGVADVETAFGISSNPINASYNPSTTNLKRLLNTVLDPQNVQMNAKIDNLLQRYSDKSIEKAPPAIELLGGNLFSALQDHFSSTTRRLKEELFSTHSNEYWNFDVSNAVSAFPSFGAQYTPGYVFSQSLLHEKSVCDYLMDCFCQSQHITDKDGFYKESLPIQVQLGVNHLSEVVQNQRTSMDPPASDA